MRLTDSQLKQAILHPEKLVRSAALSYFNESFTRDPQVTQLAIEATEKYGWKEVVRHYHNAFTNLPLTEDSLRWFLNDLKHDSDPDQEQWDVFRRALLQAVLEAEPALLAKYRDEIENLDVIEPDDVTHLHERLEFAERDPEKCWEQLQQHCEAIKSAKSFLAADTPHGKRLAEACARFPQQFGDRVVALLAHSPPGDAGDPAVWVEGFLIVAAGRMRLNAAAPLVVKKLHNEWDWISEEAQEALKRIGSPAVLDAICADYPSASWHFRNYATGVLENLPSDDSPARICELITREQDEFLAGQLGCGLANQFDLDAVEAARQVALADPDDMELQPIRELLVVTSLLSDQKFPELDAWRLESEAYMRREASWYTNIPTLSPGKVTNRFSFDDAKKDTWNEEGPDETFEEEVLPPSSPDTIRNFTKRVGRNDPCPCGSGKKFKKCCLHKTAKSIDD